MPLNLYIQKVPENTLMLCSIFEFVGSGSEFSSAGKVDACDMSSSKLPDVGLQITAL